MSEEFTVAGRDGEDPVLIALPLFLPIISVTRTSSEFVTIPTGPGVTLPLCSDERAARADASALDPEKGGSYRIATAAELKRVLIVASEQTGASYVGIDFDPIGTEPCPGRVVPINDIIDAIRSIES